MPVERRGVERAVSAGIHGVHVHGAREEEAERLPVPGLGREMQGGEVLRRRDVEPRRFLREPPRTRNDTKSGKAVPSHTRNLSGLVLGRIQADFCK